MRHSTSDHLSAIAAATSAKTGIPPQLLYGQLYHESAGATNRGARELHNYSGIKDVGKDKYRDFGSDEEYVSYLSRLLTDKRYSSTGLLAAKNAQEYANDLKKAGYYGDSVANYSHGIERFEGGYKTPVQSVTKGDTYINVQVATNANPDQIAKAIATKQQQQSLTGTANVTGVHQ